MKKALIFFAFLLLSTQTVFADSANLNGAGANATSLSPEQNEHIKMVDEQLIMTIYPSSLDENGYTEGYTDTDVTYTFTNTSSESQTVTLGFPERCLDYCSEESDFWRLADFKAYINDEEVDTDYIYTEYSYENFSDHTDSWYVYETVFAPNETKKIRNTYKFQHSNYKGSNRWFYYILETGSTWLGPIENLDIYIRFSPGLSLYNINSITGPSGYLMNQRDNQIEWHITNLEPTDSDNIEIDFDPFTDADFMCIVEPEYHEGYPASSSLKAEPENDLMYYPCLVGDNQIETAWVEGVDGPGIGEWIQVPLDPAKNYDKVQIFSGYGESDELWDQNNRVKDLKITFSTGFEQTVHFIDNYDYEVFTLDEIVVAPLWAKFEILNIYPGTKFDDTAISEIKVLGILPSDEETSFPDIIGHKYEESIKYCRDNKIVNGYSDGTFKPDNPINRAEFTKIIMEATYPDESYGANCFPDVKADWYAKYVCHAKLLGHIQGYPDGHFHPEDQINYVEALKIIFKGFGMDWANDDIFPAGFVIENWYDEYVYMADSMGVSLTGIEVGDYITRAEMTEMIYRLKKFIEEANKDD
ncbi:hypothetical protein GF354_03070 [Candidatus Peregrinibacteria bacterium]|nr:hypothetical protein [Candidatus Peregrinibacteria bacterium]